MQWTIWAIVQWFGAEMEHYNEVSTLEVAEKEIGRTGLRDCKSQLTLLDIAKTRP